MSKKATSPFAKRCKKVTATLEYWFSLRDCTSRKSKREIIGVKSDKTVTARKNNPGSYTLEELWKLQSSLKIPSEEFNKFFANL